MADGKWIRGVPPEAAVADAARVVLAARLEVVRHYLPLAVDRPYDDPEYVHQLRVGTRRAAAAVKVFADCLPRKHLKAAKDALRTIRRAAGDARDWDVFLQSLTADSKAAAADARPAFDFLLGYALSQRSAAQARLVEAAAAAGPGFAPATAILPARVRPPKGDATPQTFGDRAAAHLGGLLFGFGAAVEANPTDPGALHRLRIRGKELRYAMEIFAGCFAPPLREVLYPLVEAVQEVLGQIQDAAVGTARLEAMRDVVQRVAPDEWLRLAEGIDGLIRGFREKVPAGRERFTAWRGDWAAASAAYPLDAILLTPAD